MGIVRQVIAMLCATARRYVVPTLAGQCLAVLPTKAAWTQVVFEVARKDIWTTGPVAGVTIAGDFNDWDEKDTPLTRNGETWRVSLPLSDGRHYYKFFWTDAAGKARAFHDHANPFLVDTKKWRSVNFVYVRNGKRVEHPEGLERFEWSAPKAKAVYVHGDFNNMARHQFPLTRQADGTFVTYLEIPRPFTYRFIVDEDFRIPAATAAPAYQIAGPARTAPTS